MPNSDNSYGVFNKQSNVWTPIDVTYTLGHPQGVELTNPCRINIGKVHGITDSSQVSFTDLTGTTQLNGNTYYAKVINTTTIDLYTDIALSTAVDGTGYTAFSGTEGQITVTLAKVIHANTSDALNHFLTSEGQAVFNECATQLQWELVNDDNGDATGLKHTAAFGTKGNNDPENDWAEQYNSRKTALINANNWSATGFVATPSEDHLF
jgi:hypothetical protein